MADHPKITAIIVLLAYSSKHQSPEYPDVSEWKACNKPLGLWNSVWAVKVGFDCLVVFWGYRRERASRAMNSCVSCKPFFPLCPPYPSVVLGIPRPDPCQLRFQISTLPELCEPARLFLLGAQPKRRTGSPETMPETMSTSPTPHYMPGS